MCGIIVTKDASRIALIKHRGTEHGVTTYKDYLLGHHRLPIQTLSNDQWSQPYVIDNNTVILYNGELFDVPDYRDNDLDLIANKLMEENSIEDFADWIFKQDGFFSLVIVWKGTLYVLTDPLGKKPLYYNNEGEICSEIKALINDKPKINMRVIQQIGAMGYSSSLQTCFEGVSQFAPGCMYIMEKTFLFGDQFRLIRASRLYPEKVDNKTLFTRIERATRNRLIGHEPIGCFVSGGLDSSIIAYHLRHSPVKFYTISNGPDTEYVRILEKFLGIRVETVELDKNVQTEQILHFNESPQDMGSMIPQFLLFKAAKEKVVLTGDGADELFGGYRRASYYDSFATDMEELTHYHLPRIDKMSMAFTIEARQPFLSLPVVTAAMGLDPVDRVEKKILKDIYGKILPEQIVNRKKYPLKTDEIRNDEKQQRYQLIKQFLELWK